MWGGVSIYVGQRFDTLAIIISVIGLALLIFSFIYKDQQRFQKNNGQPEQEGSSQKPQAPQWRKLGIVVAIALLAFIFTVGVNYFSYSLPYRWDVTAGKQHTLTASTIKYVKGIRRM